MCAIAGAVSKTVSRRLVRMVAAMLQVLQTRGDEACGLAYSDGENIKIRKDRGKVTTVFTDKLIKDINKFCPLIIMGHNLYRTAGSEDEENIHPQYLKLGSGKGAFAFNGNVHDLEKKKKSMIDKGAVFDSDGDTEFILNYIWEAGGRYWRNLVQAISKFMVEVPCVYSASLMVHEKLFLFRDPSGNRPLCYGYVNNIFVYASEDSALKKIGARKIKEVEAGTIMEIHVDGTLKIHRVFSQTACSHKCAKCIFEGIYFARPDSFLFNELPVDIFRQKLGAQLYEQCQLKPDCVSSVPSSGDQGAIGYSNASGVDAQNLLLKDSSIDRTFTSPGERNRWDKARLKYTMLARLVYYYKYSFIMFIDDSIVRSTTMRVLLKSIRQAIRKVTRRKIKVGIGIVSPRIENPCYYGIAMPTYGELIAHDKTTDEIREIIGADELHYLSLENLEKVMVEMGLDPRTYCRACFNGEYVIPLE